MACIMLHDLCIHMNDPCEPRWRLEIEELELVDKVIVSRPIWGNPMKTDRKFVTGYGIALYNF